MVVLAGVELGGETVEARLPEVAVVGEPGVELAERLGAEGVEAALPIRADPHEAGGVEAAELLGDAGLVNLDLADEVADGALAGTQGVEEAAAGGVGEQREDVSSHALEYC